MTRRIVKCIDIKHRLFIQLKRHEITYGVYKTYSALLKRLLYLVERNYRRKQFSNNYGNTRKTFKTINDMLGKGNSLKPSSFMINGVKETDNRKIADAFMNYFGSVAQNVQNSINQHNGENLLNIVPRNENTFYMNPSRRREIVQIVKALKKCSGVQAISLKVLRLGIDVFSNIISDLFNLSFLSSVYPSDFKVARVVPIFKSGNKSHIDNYRPISVLPVLNKIFEKLIFVRMLSFCNRYNLIRDTQFGFRSGSNTDRAALNLIFKILPSFEMKNYALTVFIDLRKAFDTIDHELLISKLSRYGFRGMMSDYLKSYLQHRQQFIDFNGTNSDKIICNLGVPQGSILGPLFFNIYINDLDYYINDVDIVKYADDTVLSQLNSSLELLSEHMQSCLDKLTLWCNFNKLALNGTKTKFMIFTNNPYVSPQLNVEQAQIEEVSLFKYLGISFDSSLKFNPHYEHLAIKLSRFAGITRRLAGYFDKKTARIFYFSSIYSIISYGILVWGGGRLAHSQRGQRLQALQDRIVKNLFSQFCPNYTSTSEIYFSFSLLKLCDIYNLRVAATMYDILKNNKYPEFLNHFLALNIEHDYLTRNQNLTLPFPRVDAIRYNFVYQFVKIWNCVPKDIKNSCSLKIFKTEYSTFILHFYSN